MLFNVFFTYTQQRKTLYANIENRRWLYVDRETGSEMCCVLTLSLMSVSPCVQSWAIAELGVHVPLALSTEQTSQSKGICHQCTCITGKKKINKNQKRMRSNLEVYRTIKFLHLLSTLKSLCLDSICQLHHIDCLLLWTTNVVLYWMYYPLCLVADGYYYPFKVMKKRENKFNAEKYWQGIHDMFNDTKIIVGWHWTYPQFPLHASPLRCVAPATVCCKSSPTGNVAEPLRNGALSSSGEHYNIA